MSNNKDKNKNENSLNIYQEVELFNQSPYFKEMIQGLCSERVKEVKGLYYEVFNYVSYLRKKYPDEEFLIYCTFAEYLYEPFSLYLEKIKNLRYLNLVLSLLNDKKDKNIIYDLDILRQADILQVAHNLNISLSRKGNLYLALCPLHEEKTPSFTIYPNTSSFYCFGCGIGGNSIDLAMKVLAVDFVTAIHFLTHGKA